MARKAVHTLIARSRILPVESHSSFTIRFLSSTAFTLYRFTNARRRIVPRMKEEMQDTRSKASSAPDLMVSSSSSNETLGERGESLMARRKSVAMRRRRHISEDSSGTSPTSGKHYLDDDDDHIPAGLRRDSLSVPDLHSSCCSQLAALLERTPSGRIVSDRQPSIAGKDFVLNVSFGWNSSS